MQIMKESVTGLMILLKARRNTAKVSRERRGKGGGRGGKRIANEVKGVYADEVNGNSKTKIKHMAYV